MTKSNTKFIIRYEDKEGSISGKKIMRYSSKLEHELVRTNKLKVENHQIYPHSYHSKTSSKPRGKEGSVPVGSVPVGSVPVPSYLKPTESSLSGQIDRQRVASVSDIPTDNKPGFLKLRSKSVQEEENENQKEYNRVPIEYFDEKAHGCGADSLRARVIFRGYAPKNTYYYLKTLKPYRRRHKKPLTFMSTSLSALDQQRSQFIPTSSNFINSTTQHSPPPTPIAMPFMKNQNQIKFQSKFESGNLAAAARISLTQYWLYMREDTNTHGLRQWYYFTVSNKKPIKIKLRIYRFTKTYSLYRVGMKPYIRTSAMTDFMQAGDKVRYEFDNLQKCYFLEFQYKFQEEAMQVQIAMLPVYTYTMLKEFLKTLENYEQSTKEEPAETLKAIQTERNLRQSITSLTAPTSSRLPLPLSPSSPTPTPTATPTATPTPTPSAAGQKPVKIEIRSMGQSLAGLDMPLIEIKKNPLAPTMMFSPGKQKTREAIIILCRTHPGETVSNFSLEKFIQTVIGNQEIIQYFDFFIVPMVNPDGVYFGNHRTSISGQDLNRNFQTTDSEAFPEIQAINSTIAQIKRSHRIRYLLDLHGHSSRKNIFAYGPQHQLSTPEYLHSHILPKLLNDSISSFKYNYCIFKDCKQKKNTARVHFTNKFKFSCLTFEQSYGLVDEGNIGVQNWRNFGSALAFALLEFARIFTKGREPALESYLAEEINVERVFVQKTNQRHRKMLGITSNSQDVDGVMNDEKNRTLPQIIRHKPIQKNISLLPITEQFSFTSTNTAPSSINDLYIHNSYNNTHSHIHSHNRNNSGLRMPHSHSYSQPDPQEKILEREEEESKQSVESSELSSGDESLELLPSQLEAFKKDIVRVGCHKQGLKRAKYNIADKKLQLFDYREDKDPTLDSNMNREDSYYFRRLHQLKFEPKSSMIPRIVKLQQKKKEDYNLSFKREFRDEWRDALEKERQERKREIQAKFRKMELPSISTKK